MQSLVVEILQRSDKEKNTFKEIEKFRYSLWKNVSKHLKNTFEFLEYLGQ